MIDGPPQPQRAPELARRVLAALGVHVALVTPPRPGVGRGSGVAGCKGRAKALRGGAGRKGGGGAEATRGGTGERATGAGGAALGGRAGEGGGEQTGTGAAVGGECGC